MQPLTVSEAYDRVADHYDEVFNRPLDHAENDVIFRRLAHLDGLNVLDMGCGTGLYLEYRQPGRYTGIDISEGMLEKARAKFPQAKFYNRDMANVGHLFNEPFDAIVSTFGCMSYCNCADKIAAEVCRLLKPGGEFWIMALGPRHPCRRTHITNGETPTIYYTAQDLLTIFAGFENLTVTGLNIWGDILANVLGNRIGSYLELEYRTLGRWTPSNAYSLIVQGRKGA